jgi:hypothetical protein
MRDRCMSRATLTEIREQHPPCIDLRRVIAGVFTVDQSSHSSALVSGEMLSDLPR